MMLTKKIKYSILLVEDNDDHAEMVEELLKRDLSIRYDVTRAKTLKEGIKQSQSSVFDIALLDLSLPDSSMKETLERFRSDNLNLPVIVLTSLSDEDVAVHLLEHGAQDYLPKEDISTPLLSRSIRYTKARIKTDNEVKECLAELATVKQQVADKDVNIVELRRQVNELSRRLDEPLPYVGKV